MEVTEFNAPPGPRRDGTRLRMSRRAPLGRRGGRRGVRTPTGRRWASRPTTPPSGSPTTSSRRHSHATRASVSDRPRDDDESRLSRAEQSGVEAGDAEPAARGQRGVRGALRPRLPDPGSRSQRRRDPRRAGAPPRQRRRLRARGDGHRAPRHRAAASRRAGADEPGDHPRPRHRRRPPARGVPVDPGETPTASLATAVTDADGRVGELGPERLAAGTYRLRFDTAAYARTGGAEPSSPRWS